MSKYKISYTSETSEVKHIFIDIVNYTYNRSVEAQTYIIEILNQIVKETINEKKISDESIIFIPTGDGMCISILQVLNPYDIHLQIGIEILKKIDEYNKTQNDSMRRFYIRIGINENIDNIIVDINGKKNISGSGINFAARIESLCDYNQILVGNSVFEKLVQREKYMNSFTSYSTEVKHGVAITVHQYKNTELIYLNNFVPSKFFQPKKEITLNIFQAYYIANCIVQEDFAIKNNGGGQNAYSLQVLFFYLTEDEIAKSRATKTKPDYRKKISRTLQEQYNYIQSVDFWLICDLAFYQRNEFKNIENCFNDEFCFVSEFGKKKLISEHPQIANFYNIT